MLPGHRWSMESDGSVFSAIAQRRRLLASLDLDGLEDLRSKLKRARAWPAA